MPAEDDARSCNDPASPNYLNRLWYVEAARHAGFLEAFAPITEIGGTASLGYEESYMTP